MMIVFSSTMIFSTSSRTSFARSPGELPSVPSLKQHYFWLERGERLSGSIDLAQDVFVLGFPNITLGIFVARGQEREIASASSRVEAKLFSVMNSVRSRKKRSTRFIQDDEVGV